MGASAEHKILSPREKWPKAEFGMFHTISIHPKEGITLRSKIGHRNFVTVGSQFLPTQRACARSEPTFSSEKCPQKAEFSPSHDVKYPKEGKTLNRKFVFAIYYVLPTTADARSLVLLYNYY